MKISFLNFNNVKGKCHLFLYLFIFQIAFLFLLIVVGCNKKVDQDIPFKSAKGISMSPGVSMVVGNSNRIDQISFVVPKDSTFCQLTVTEECTLKVSTDYTVCALKQGIIAKDTAGVVWESKKIIQNNVEIYAFIKKH